MKSIVFFRARLPKPGPGYRDYGLIKAGCCRREWVRAEIVDGDIGEALEKAKPREGETVLNSIPLD